LLANPALAGWAKLCCAYGADCGKSTPVRKEDKRKIRRVSLIFDLLCHDLKKSN